MIILDYQKKYHKKIIHACVLALKQGKVLAYQTDTSYGLAVDASNISAIKKLYKIKGRNFNKPSSIVVPSVAYAKKIVRWGKIASKLAKRWWPGVLTLVLGQRAKGVGASFPVLRIRLGGEGGSRPQSKTGAQAQPLRQTIKTLSASTGWIGLRMPKNDIALDLAKILKYPITATSANVSGQADCYSADEVIEQFKKQKYRPDIIINAGKLLKRKPSTLVKIEGKDLTILRQGPISEKQIRKLLGFSL